MTNMTAYETLSIIISVFALGISLFALFKSISQAYGNIELYINERITNTKEKVSELSLIISPLSTKTKRIPDEEKLLENYKTIYQTAIENNLNAYEEACAKYLDSKVDRKRFIKTYKTEIRQLVEDKNLKHKFDALTSRYKAIVKVYNEWENLEK